jgi:pyridoxal phosphate enzyme (YggS family)
MIAHNLAAARAHIEAAAKSVGRDPAGITLIAVSKQQPDDRIDAALAAGQRVFGENRVQEARARWEARRAQYTDLELHLIGPLQTNKVKEAVALFDAIHTLDRPKLAAALMAEMAKQGRRLTLFAEVNTGEEPQKAGLTPAALPEFLTACVRDYQLPVSGLMCIPPIHEPPALHFALLSNLAKTAALPLLSMGMSDDFETAVRCGATHIRIGTALFGVRPESRPADDGLKTAI